MRIVIDDRLYAQAFDVLGRAGEREYREIDCEFPPVDGAQFYKIRFELVDGSCYEINVTQGKAVVPYSLLASPGFVRAQFIATASDGSGNYEIIAKSNVFYCVVGPSISGKVEPIPTYEDAQKMLEKINDALKDHEVGSRIVTEEEYRSMQEHSDKVIYYVIDDSGNISVYLGDVLIMGTSIVSDMPRFFTYRHFGDIDMFGKYALTGQQ